MVVVASVCQPSTLRMLIWREASSAQNNMAAVSAEGSTVWVLIRRLNSLCSRSIAFVEDRPLYEAREDEIAHSMRRPLANTLVRSFRARLIAT
jgi:hypothetical protein